MVKNYLKIALRNLYRHLGYTFINLIGLAVALTCCLLIGLFVQDELRYDQQHPHIERLYRLGNALSEPTGEIHVAITPAVYAEKMDQDYPEIEQFARMHPASRSLIVHRDDKRFFEKQAAFFYTDAGFFELFHFPLAKGNPETALTRPFSIVLTPQLSQKYFGDQDPLGEPLRLGEATTFTVTGVLEASPKQSHLSFNALLSMASLHEMSDQKGPGGLDVYGPNGDYFTSWHFAAGNTYIRLTPDAQAESFEAKLPGFIERHLPAEFHSKYRPFLQPVRDIYLYSDVLYDLSKTSTVAYLYIFSAIGLFVLLIACINYVNLATARAMQRAREVGVRKVLGAHRKQLVAQFLGESMLLVVLALGVAVLLAWVCLPYFNMISEKGITIDHGTSRIFLLGLLVVSLFVGLVAGGYPAFFLASLRPVKMLRGNAKGLASYGGLRRGLVVFQFAASVILLISTGIMYEQLAFFQSKDLGFDKGDVVVVELPDETSKGRYEVFRRALGQHPNVINITASSTLPGIRTIQHNVQPEDMPSDEWQLMALYAVDYDFIETMGVELLAGRSFSQDLSTDSTQAYLINEAAVAQLGWKENPIGHEFTWINPKKGPQTGHIIGVLKDFHFRSLHVAIEPVFFTIAPEWYEFLSIRIRPDQMEETLDFLEAQWTMLAPSHPFDYTFLDETLGGLYNAEERLGVTIGTFAFIALLVGCLGVFGLTSFTVERRRQEIGVRKVFGASASSIALLLSKEFAGLVVLAAIIAAPLAYLLMDRWLQTFVYRVEIGLGIFLWAGALALLVALLTASYQSIKAAMADPVKSLRYE